MRTTEQPGWHQRRAGRDVSPRKSEKLKKLANADFSRFAVAVQHMSAEVQMKLIEQLPEFRKLATEALEANDKAFQSILKSNDEGENAPREAHKKWRHTWRACSRTRI